MVVYIITQEIWLSTSSMHHALPIQMIKMDKHSDREVYLYKGGTFSAGLAVIFSGEGGWTDGSDTVISIFCRNIQKWPC